MHSEYLLKERFHGELWAQLSPAQQQALTAPEHLGVADADLLHPILTVIHSAPLLVGEGEQQIVDELRQAMIEQHQLAETEPPLVLVVVSVRNRIAAPAAGDEPLGGGQAGPDRPQPVVEQRLEQHDHDEEFGEHDHDHDE